MRRDRERREDRPGGPRGSGLRAAMIVFSVLVAIALVLGLALPFMVTSE